MKRMVQAALGLLILFAASCSESPVETRSADMAPLLSLDGGNLVINWTDGPEEPVAVKTPVQVSAEFVGGTGDAHTAEIRWGDGASSVARVTEEDGTGIATATRSYVLPGVYTVEIEIRNQDEESVVGIFEYVTVYDPDGGYVSGNGTLLSPAGACTWDGCVADAGTARFGASSRYRRGAHVPDGNTRFTFRDGNFTFSSTEYEWLVISGSRAQYKGIGTVNRQGSYGFMLTAVDSDRPGGGADDRVRIKVWDLDNDDEVVYDNQRGTDNGGGLTHDGTLLTSGKITIRSTTRNTEPVIVITSPADGASFSESVIRLAADAGDAEDGDLSELVVWASDLAGELGTGAEVLGVVLEPGAHVITASVTDSEGLEGSASVVVEILEVAYKLSVAPVDAIVEEGETQQFTATVYADGVEMTEDVPTITWSSNDEAVATIDQDGLATGVRAGEATITAAIGDVEETAALTVEEIATGPEILASTLSAGTDYVCGLTPSGNGYCWGANWGGQLGDGSTNESVTPVAVLMPEGVSFGSISAGNGHTVALSTVGTAYTWGTNVSGQLGDGTTTSSSTPVAAVMPAGVSFVAIDAGHSHTIALSSMGAAYAWGWNSNGILGDGTTTNRNTPVAITMPAGVSFVSVGAGVSHTIALSSSGAAYAWGANGVGQLGNGTTTASSTPVAVTMPGGVSFASISAGRSHTVAISSTGAAYSWGGNVDGQLGDGTQDQRNTPVAVEMPAGVTFSSVATGNHTVALSTTGVGYAWGANRNGQLGNGTITNQEVLPVAVTMPAGASFSSVTAGDFHSAAISSTGTAYAWGRNTRGQLGDGTAEGSSEPVAVSGGITFR